MTLLAHFSLSLRCNQTHPQIGFIGHIEFIYLFTASVWYEGLATADIHSRTVTWVECTCPCTGHLETKHNQELQVSLVLCSTMPHHSMFRSLNLFCCTPHIKHRSHFYISGFHTTFHVISCQIPYFVLSTFYTILHSMKFSTISHSHSLSRYFLKVHISTYIWLIFSYQ